MDQPQTPSDHQSIQSSSTVSSPYSKMISFFTILILLVVGGSVLLNKIKGDKYQVVGSEVIKTSKGQETILFKNVTNVQEVRLGPDARTLHFKLKNFDARNRQEICADLETKVIPAGSDYKDPPPSSPPWDYQKIAHYATINHCNTYYAGGYLKNSDYFVYLVLTNPKTGKLYYENLKTGELKKIPIKSELLTGYNDGEKAQGNNPGNANSYWDEAIVDKNGYQYFYPQQDSYVENNKLVLAIGTLILAIDIQKNSLVGNIVQQGVVTTSFRFINQKPLPFIVVESAWEGPPQFNEIIDVSDGNFKVTDLSKLDRRSFFDFKIEPIIWETNSILFNFADFEDVTKKLPSSYDFNNLPINDEVKIAQINSQAEQLLKKKSNYLEVKCSLGPGMVSGCDALKKINHYKYTSKEGLIKQP